MRTRLERCLAVAAGALVAAGLAVGCSGSSSDNGGGGGAKWLTGSGGSDTGGKTTAGTGGVATGGVAGALTTGGAATGGTGSTCLGDTTVSADPPTCADLPYVSVVCAGSDDRPAGLAICQDYEGVARPGVMEDLIDCLAALPADTDDEACTLQSEGVWVCVQGIEATACAANDSASLCTDLNEVCPNDVTTTQCVGAFNTLTSAGRNAAYTCMMGEPDCSLAWDKCFPVEI